MNALGQECSSRLRSEESLTPSGGAECPVISLCCDLDTHGEESADGSGRPLFVPWYVHQRRSFSIVPSTPHTRLARHRSGGKARRSLPQSQRRFPRCRETWWKVWSSLAGEARVSEPTLSSTASRLVIAGCEWLEDAPVERPVSGPAHHPGDRVPGTSPDSSQEEARGARSWLLDDPEEMKGNKYFSC